MTGLVGGHRVTAGNRALVAELHPHAAAALEAHAPGAESGLRAYVALDGEGTNAASGVITFGDRMRDDLPAFIARLNALGLTRTVLLSGDHTENVKPVADALGPVVMVGDGTNDAPALSAATVGVALAAHGGGISAEAAGVVLLADDVTRVEDAVRIGQRAVMIARQSIVAGLVLSGSAMVVAALGFIPPTAGALIQEAIDVAVILNALRAAQDHRAGSASPV